MARTFLFLFVTVVCMLPAWASEPGQPMDCSDFVFLVPGLSCSMAVADCGSPPNPWCEGGSVFLDNQGYRYRVREISTGEPCGGVSIIRSELLRFNATEETVVAYVEGRCVTPGVSDNALPGPPAAFDEVRGRMFLSMRSICTGCAVVDWNAAIEGFATTFEILQSYTPETLTIGFRVPYMPEGFQHADWFDTYYGDLSTVGDWSQAQPLQCSYPATAPALGDYLTVEDTLPTPPAGEGYYFITAATHMGEKRYGRKSSSRVLTGRDPAVLPACVE